MYWNCQQRQWAQIFHLIAFPLHLPHYISDVITFATILEDSTSDATHMSNIQEVLLQNQPSVRNSPGNGDCLFHSFLFSWNSQFLQEPFYSIKLLLTGVRLNC